VVLAINVNYVSTLHVRTLKIATRILFTLLLNFFLVLLLSGMFLCHDIHEEKLYNSLLIESKKLSLILRLDNYILTCRIAYYNMHKADINQTEYRNIYELNKSQIPFLIEEIETHTLTKAQQNLLFQLQQEIQHGYSDLSILKILSSIEELAKLTYTCQKDCIKNLKQFNKKTSIVYFVILISCLLLLLISLMFTYKHINTPTNYLVSTLQSILQEDKIIEYKGTKVGEFQELFYYFAEVIQIIKEAENKLKEKDLSAVRYKKQVDMLLLYNRKLQKLQPLIKKHLTRNIDETVGDF
jgi:hypothetical protein